MRLVALVLAIIGVLAAVAAILYFALPAHSLPSFLPGHIAHVNGHRNRRGIGAAVVALLLLLVAWMISHHDRPVAAA